MNSINYTNHAKLNVAALHNQVHSQNRLLSRLERQPTEILGLISGYGSFNQADQLRSCSKNLSKRVFNCYSKIELHLSSFKMRSSHEFIFHIKAAKRAYCIITTSIFIHSFSELNNEELIKIFLRTCPNPRTIDLSWHPLITDTSLKAIAEGSFSNLHTLDLTWCRLITDIGLKAIAEGSFSNLHTLKLRHCNQITDSGLRAIAKGRQKNLHTLDLTWCDLITGAGIEALVESSQNLNTITITGCDITSEEVVALMEKYKNIKFIDNYGLPL